MTARSLADVVADAVRAMRTTVADQTPDNLGRIFVAPEAMLMEADRLEGVAIELAALDATHVLVPKDRWPSDDEIAGLRGDVAKYRKRAASHDVLSLTDRLTAFLDRLDPPDLVADST